MRRTAFVASFAVVAWAAVAVPMPFFETQPAGSHPVEDLVTISAATGEVNGDLELLTIRQHTPNVLEALWVALHPDRDLERSDQRLPTGLDLETYRDIQAGAFTSAFITAVAVAATEVGYDIPVQTRAVVAQVLPEGPAAGALEPGDELVAVDGAEVASGAELIEVLGGVTEPVEVTLGVRRDGELRDVVVELAMLPDLGRPGLGIVVETLTAPVELPFDATLGETSIVGPSAGMMVAVTAADLLLDEDLAAGRVIAGTGTIDGEGRIGAIGGIEQKVRAAIAAEADLVLVPISQLEVAVDAAAGRIEVVGVATFADALDALRGTGDDRAAPAGD